LAEKGVKLHTIMSVLGHTNATMSMVYTRISDREVLKDYQAVLGPGAVIAGPCADMVRAGTLFCPWVSSEGPLWRCVCISAPR